MWSSHDFLPLKVKYFVSATHSCQLLPGLTPTANLVGPHIPDWVNAYGIRTSQGRAALAVQSRVRVVAGELVR